MSFLFSRPMDAYAQWKRKRQEARDARTLTAALDIIVKRIESGRSDVRWWGEMIRNDLAGIRRDFECSLAKPKPKPGEVPALPRKKRKGHLTKKPRRRNH